MLAAIPHAEAASGESTPQKQAGNDTISVTLSTLNLAQPLLSSEDDVARIKHTPHLEVMVEGKIAEKFGVAGFANYGRADIEYKIFDGAIDVDQISLGAQGLWYPVGHFGDGMQVGAHLDHSEAFTGQEQVEGVDLQANLNYTSVAGLIGYKTVIEPGLTIVGQVGGGPRFLHTRAEGSSGGAEASREDEDVLPFILFNFNLGWSF
jgi:hypothetical protein